MTVAYSDFLASKRYAVPSSGIDVEPEAVHPLLFPFQRDLVRWAVRKGRVALFADTGLGKTFMQLEWARLIGERTLILAPLAVAQQTIQEARRLGIGVAYARSQEEAPESGITISNYESAPHEPLLVRLARDEVDDRRHPGLHRRAANGGPLHDAVELREEQLTLGSPVRLDDAGLDRQRR